MISMTRILLDSNVLIYSLTVGAPKQKKAQEFIQKQSDYICVTHQNITETLKVLTQHQPADMHNHSLESILAVTEHLSFITPQPQTAELFIQLVKNYNRYGKRVFDTYLAATALSHNITTIATDNVRDFQMFEELTIINPFE